MKSTERNRTLAQSQFVPTWDGLFEVTYGEKMLKQPQETKGDHIYFTGPKSIVISAIAQAQSALSSPEALKQKLQTGSTQEVKSKETLDWSKLPVPSSDVKETASIFTKLFSDLIPIVFGVKLIAREIFDESKGAKCEGGKLVSADLHLAVSGEVYRHAIERLSWRFKEITRERFHAALTGGQPLPEVGVDVSTLTDIPFLVYLIGKSIRIIQELNDKGVVASSRLEFDYSYLYQCLTPPKFELMPPITPSTSSLPKLDKKQITTVSSPEEEQATVVVNKHHLRRSFMQLLGRSYHVKQGDNAIVVDFFDDETAASKKPLCLIEVVDESGSLAEDNHLTTLSSTGSGPFEHIKNDLIQSAELLYRMDQHAEIHYFFFSSQISQVQEFNATNKNRVSEFVKSRKTGDSTALSAAVLKALQHIKSSELYRTHNVFVRVKTDGIDNDGHGKLDDTARINIEENNKDIVAMIQFFQNEASRDPRVAVPQIRIHAYGDSVDTAYLKKLNALTGGSPDSYTRISMVGKKLGVISQDELKNPEFNHERRVLKFLIQPESEGASAIEQTNTVLLTGAPQRLIIHTPFALAQTVTVNGKPLSLKQLEIPKPQPSEPSIDAASVATETKAIVVDSKVSVAVLPVGEPLADVTMQASTVLPVLSPATVPTTTAAEMAINDAASLLLSQDEQTLTKLIDMLHAKQKSTTDSAARLAALLSAGVTSSSEMQYEQKAAAIAEDAQSNTFVPAAANSYKQFLQNLQTRSKKLPGVLGWLISNTQPLEVATQESSLTSSNTNSTTKKVVR